MHVRWNISPHLTHSNISLSSVLRHVQNTSILSFFMSLRARLLVSISEGKGCIALLSKHCSKWSRMDVPSVLKCMCCTWGGSSPAQRAVAKANAKIPQSFELVCLSTATNSKLIRRLVGIRIEQICCFVLRGIAVFMGSYTLKPRDSNRWLILSANGLYWSEAPE